MASPLDLLREHRPIVEAEARRLSLYRRDWEDDLRSAGLLALWSAAQTFQPALGRTFVAWARFKVRRAMIDELRRIAPHTRRDVAYHKQRAKVEADLMHRFRREPTPAEIARAMGEPVAKSSRDWRRSRSWVSLDQTMPDGRELAGIIPDPGAKPGDEMEEAEQHAMALHLIETLDPAARRVIKMRFLDGMKLDAIARLLGLTESRISQIVTRGCSDLRRRLLKAA